MSTIDLVLQLRELSRAAACGDGNLEHLFDDAADKIESLLRDREECSVLLHELICWAGESADGPSWASKGIRSHNVEQCERAIHRACALLERIEAEEANEVK